MGIETSTGSACSDIIGILISCAVFSRMYGPSRGIESFQEIHTQVTDRIPIIYAEILDFSFSLKKHMSRSKGSKYCHISFTANAACQNTNVILRPICQGAGQLSSGVRQIWIKNQIYQRSRSCHGRICEEGARTVSGLLPSYRTGGAKRDAIRPG